MFHSKMSQDFDYFWASTVNLEEYVDEKRDVLIKAAKLNDRLKFVSTLENLHWFRQVSIYKLDASLREKETGLYRLRQSLSEKLGANTTEFDRFKLEQIRFLLSITERITLGCSSSNKRLRHAPLDVCCFLLRSEFISIIYQYVDVETISNDEIKILRNIMPLKVTRSPTGLFEALLGFCQADSKQTLTYSKCDAIVSKLTHAGYSFFQKHRSKTTLASIIDSKQRQRKSPSNNSFCFLDYLHHKVKTEALYLRFFRAIQTGTNVEKLLAEHALSGEEINQCYRLGFFHQASQSDNGLKTESNDKRASSPYERNDLLPLNYEDYQQLKTRIEKDKEEIQERCQQLEIEIESFKTRNQLEHDRYDAIAEDWRSHTRDRLLLGHELKERSSKLERERQECRQLLADVEDYELQVKQILNVY